jgi:hypothetical protein
MSIKTSSIGLIAGMAVSGCLAHAVLADEPDPTSAPAVTTGLKMPADALLPDWLRSPYNARHADPGTIAEGLPASYHPALVRPPQNCVPCPPSTPPTPSTPAEPKKSAEPNVAPNENAPNQFAGATEAGTQPGAMFNPNMFGDQFGSSRGTLTATVGTLTAQSFLSTPGASTVATIASPTAALNVPITNATVSAAAATNTNLTLPKMLPVTATGATPITTTVSTGVNATQAYLTLFPLPGVNFAGGAVPLQNNAAYQQFAASVFNQRFGPNGQVIFQGGDLSAGAGSTGTPLNQPPARVNFTPSTQVYFTYSYLATMSVPLPSSGGVVGFTTISENNSPMPRDRVFFDYDYFSNASLTPGGIDVNHFTAGFEKTFLNGRASFEMLLPFASTLDSSSFADGAASRATVLGDLYLTFKGLFYASKEFDISSGFGLALPTAPNTNVQMANGADLVRIKDESVVVTPFVAALFTPNDRFFAQTWLEIGFDASGSPVYGNPNMTGLVGVGRLYQQALLQVDTQVGYWLVRETGNASFLSGLAPFVELHYNTPLDNADSARSGSFVIGSVGNNRFNELNISTGVNMVFNNRANVMAGVVLPLNGGGNKFFDAQFGIRMNWLFGATEPRSAVSNF